MTSRRALIALGGILVAMFLVNLPVLNEPFGRDQGIYAYIGDGLNHGLVPYRDAWDHKPPGLYFIYALAFRLFGREMASVHLFEAFWVVLTSALTYALGARLAGRRAGLWAAAFYGLGATLLFNWWDRAQAEMYMGAPILAAALAVAMTSPPNRGQSSPPDPLSTAVERGNGGSGVGAGSPCPYCVVPGVGGGQGDPAPTPAGGDSEFGRAAVEAACPAPGFIPAVVSGLVGTFAGMNPGAGHAGHTHRCGPTRTRLVCLLLAGLFAGLALYLKPTNAAVVAALGIYVLWQALARGTDWRERVAAALRDGLALGAGFVLAFVPLLAYFAWQGHMAFNAFFQTVVVFNTYHVQTGDTPTLERALWGTLDFGARMSLLGPLGALGAVTAFNWRPRRAGWLLLVVLVGAMGGVWLQGKFFSYHWSPALPGLALLAAQAVVGLRDELRARGGFRVVALTALVLTAIVLVYAGVWVRDDLPRYRHDLAYLSGRMDREAYLEFFGHNLLGRDVYSFRAARDTAEYLRANTKPDDTVLVWGFQALVNFLAERRAPTRYVFNYPLTFEQPESEFRREARATFMNDLDTHKPPYIVLVTNDVNPLQTVDSLTLLKDFPEFQAYINARYKLERDIADFHLYRRAD